MRESIGGTWLFGIVITFIALFSAFLSYAISYTKAFNLKSEILNMIERSEGWTESEIDDLDNVTQEELDADESVEGRAYNLVKSMGYNYTAVASLNCSGVKGHEAYSDLGSGKNIEKGGYCVTKYCPALTGYYDDATGQFIPQGGTNTKTYYKVTTFIAIKIPVIDLLLTIPISGETRTLFYDQSDASMTCTKN